MKNYLYNYFLKLRGLIKGRKAEKDKVFDYSFGKVMNIVDRIGYGKGDRNKKA